MYVANPPKGFVLRDDIPLWDLATLDEPHDEWPTQKKALKYSEDQPRAPAGSPEGGQWTSGGGGGGGTSETVHEPRSGDSGASLTDLAKLPMLDRRAAFAALTREQRDALADPRNTVPARVEELLGKDKEFTDLKSYVDQHDLLPDERDAVVSMMSRLKDDALAAGLDEKQATDLQHEMTRLVLAQDYEAAGRTLGDHGAFHLRGDEEMSKSILGVIPGNNDTPENRLMMSVAAATHDIGYLTPPSQIFLDSDHARWGQQYFDEHVRPGLEATMGKDWSAMTSNVIGGHDSTNVDWIGRPEQSAFATADNFALFHREKMPPMLREVPSNVGVLLQLGEGRLSVAAAQTAMKANIDKADYLSPRLKESYTKAVSEVNGMLPKYTLGMVGAAYKGVNWDKKNEALVVNISRGRANEGLAKTVDFGQQQFYKLAESYGTSGRDLVGHGTASFRSPKTGKTVIIANLVPGKDYEPDVIKY